MTELSRRLNVALLAGSCCAAGCATGNATGHVAAAPDKAVLAAVPAELRMMGAESTWVARGVGYELVTRSKLEILPAMNQLDDQQRFYAKLFDTEPAKVIAAVRRVGPPGTMPEASAPVPFDAGPVVEMDVPRPLRKGEKVNDESSGRGGYAGRGQGRGGDRGGDRGDGGGGGAMGATAADALTRFAAAGPATRVVRAWLSARASSFAGKPATPVAASDP